MSRLVCRTFGGARVPEWPRGSGRPAVERRSALALVSFTSGMITARSFASRNGYEIDVDRERIALGACNIAAGLSQGFAVTGADSRTAISDAMGGKTRGHRPRRRRRDGAGPAVFHRSASVTADRRPRRRADVGRHGPLRLAGARPVL